MSKQYHKEDGQSIQEMFSSIAPRYDRGNAVLSCCLFHFWNRALIEATLLQSPTPMRILDLCCGTGEITLRHLKMAHKRGVPLNEQKITLVDFSPGMLEEAQRKLAQVPNYGATLQFNCADAQALPYPNNHFDAVVIAYGIRNIAVPRNCLDEVYRVLRPGGRLGIVELTRPRHSLLRLGHYLYLRTLVPLLGRMVTDNQAAYVYLQKSVETFVTPDELLHTLRMAGFSLPLCRPLMGGIATLFLGQKGAIPALERCAPSFTSCLNGEICPSLSSG